MSTCLAAAVSGLRVHRFELFVDGCHDLAACGDEVLGPVTLERDADLLGGDEGVEVPAEADVAGDRPSSGHLDGLAEGVLGGCRIAPDSHPWPRGSHMRKVRRSSEFSMNHSRRSAMDSPGNGPTPPVTTRTGSPSVWASTVWMRRVVCTVDLAQFSRTSLRITR